MHRGQARRETRSSAPPSKLWPAPIRPAASAPWRNECRSFVDGNSSERTTVFFFWPRALSRSAPKPPLRLWRMSCSTVSSFHTLEFRHGPKAILTSRTVLTFFLSQSGGIRDRSLEEMKGIGSRNDRRVCNRANVISRGL